VSFVQIHVYKFFAEVNRSSPESNSDAVDPDFLKRIHAVPIVVDIRKKIRDRHGITTATQVPLSSTSKQTTEFITTSTTPISTTTEGTSKKVES